LDLCLCATVGRPRMIQQTMAVREARLETPLSHQLKSRRNPLATTTKTAQPLEIRQLPGNHQLNHLRRPRAATAAQRKEGDKAIPRQPHDHLRATQQHPNHSTPVVFAAKTFPLLYRKCQMFRNATIVICVYTTAGRNLTPLRRAFWL
jgi:hypothetical protein